MVFIRLEFLAGVFVKTQVDVIRQKPFVVNLVFENCTESLFSSYLFTINFCLIVNRLENDYKHGLNLPVHFMSIMAFIYVKLVSYMQYLFYAETASE